MPVKLIKLSIIAVFFVSLLIPIFTVHAGEFEGIEFKPNVSIPGNNEFKVGSSRPIEVTGMPSLMVRYIQAIYKFFVGIAGIIAVFMIVFGGVIWLFSGGSSEKISKAKEMIMGSVLGLILAIGSYTILFTINPDLVEFNINIAKVDSSSFSGKKKVCSLSTFKNSDTQYGYCGQVFDETSLPNQTNCYFSYCDGEVNKGVDYSDLSAVCSFSPGAITSRCKEKVKNIYSLSSSMANYELYSFLNNSAFKATKNLGCGIVEINRTNANNIGVWIGTDCNADNPTFWTGINDITRYLNNKIPIVSWFIDDKVYRSFCFLDLSKGPLKEITEAGSGNCTMCELLRIPAKCGD